MGRGPRADAYPDEVVMPSRIFWSGSEQAMIVSAAASLRLTRPDLSGLPLLRVAIGAALPPDRRRKLISMSQATWFEPSLASEVRRLAMRHGSHEDDPPADEHDEPPIGRLIGEASRTAVAAENSESTLALVLGELRAISVRLDALTSAFAARVVAPDSSPYPASEPVADQASRHPVERSRRLRMKPRIAIVGADLREQDAVAEKVGQTALLVFLDRTKTVRRELPDVDYLIVTRHTGHEWWDLGVKRYGRDRVQRISTSGVGMICRKIDELAKRPVASS